MVGHRGLHVEWLQRAVESGIVEGQLVSYPLPRAVHFDDEIARLLQSLDASPEQMSGAGKQNPSWKPTSGSPCLRLRP